MSSFDFKAEDVRPLTRALVDRAIRANQCGRDRAGKTVSDLMSMAAKLGVWLEFIDQLNVAIPDVVPDVETNPQDVQLNPSLR